MKARDALMGFPVTHIPIPLGFNNSRLEFPGCISLEFPPQPPTFRGLLPFNGEGSTHYRNLFVFLLYLWEGVGVGKNSLSGQASSYSALLSGHQKFTKISLSLSFLLFCHCAVRAESRQLPDSLNNIFYHSFPFSEFHTHVSHM